MSIFERLTLYILEIDNVTTCVSLSTGTSPTTKIIVPIKYCNKFKKMRALVLSQELELGWWFHHEQSYQLIYA
jgi:hypothetical protein